MNLLKKAIYKIGNGLVNSVVKESSFTVVQTIGEAFGFSKFKDKKVVKEGYLANDDVFSMISKSAKTMANQIKWRVVEVDRQGNKKIIVNPDHPWVKLLNNPNNYQTQFEWREQAYSFLMLTGKSFMGGLESIGFGFTSVHNLPSQITTFKIGDIQNPITQYKVDWSLKKIWLAEDVLFTKYINLDDRIDEYFGGLSPLRPGHRLLEASNELITADASLLKNRGASYLLSNKGQLVMTDTESKSLAASIREKVGGADKFGSIIPTSANVDVVPLGLGPKDLEILKSEVSKRRRFANIYGLDSSLFNDPDNKTFNNRREATKAAYENVYLPTDEKFVQGLTKWLTKKMPPTPGVKLIIEQDVSEVEALQQDKIVVARIKDTKSKETREILDGFMAFKYSREAAELMLTNIGYTEDEATTLTSLQPKEPTQEGNG